MADQSEESFRRAIKYAGYAALAAAVAFGGYKLFERASADTATPGAGEGAGGVDSAENTSGTSAAAPSPAETVQKATSEAPVDDSPKPMTSEERTKVWKAALALYKAKKFQAALDKYVLVIESGGVKQNQLQILMYNIAACCEKLNRVDDVIEWCTKATKVEPFYAKALGRRARALLKKGGDENELNALRDMSIPYIHAALKADGASDPPEEMQQTLKELARRRAAELFPTTMARGKETWRMPLRHGRRLMLSVWRTGHPVEDTPQEEVEAIAKAAEAADADAAAVAAYVRVLRDALDFDRALAVGKQAVDQAGGSPLPGDLLLDVGLLLHVRGALEEAREVLRRAADSDEERARVMAKVHLATIEDEMGNTKQAMAVLKEAEAQSADIEDAQVLVHYHRGTVHLTALEYSRAQQELQKCLAIRPNLAVARMQLGIVQFRLNNFKEALDCLKAARDISPDLPEVHTYLGELHALSNDVRAAEECLKHAEELDPECPLPKITRATLGIYPDAQPETPEESVTKAEALLRAVLAQDPQNVQASLRLSEILVQAPQHDTAGAEAAMRAARENARSMHELVDVLEHGLNHEGSRRALDYIRAHDEKLRKRLQSL